MRIKDDLVRLSATDLANHLGCHYLTELDLRAAAGMLQPPVWCDPMLETLQERGFEHEARYMDRLRELGLTIAEASNSGQTLEMMRKGVDVIAQASLGEGEWFGRADFLYKVDRPCDLGSWSYEVIDTKLSLETRGGTILQLCLYSELVSDLQGLTPEYMHVITPGTDYQPESFRIDDYVAYYRLVKRKLEASTLSIPGDSESFEHYPEPVPQCDICRWWSACTKRRRDDDHLSLVAGISSSQRRELADWNIHTLADLAQTPLPLPRRPKRGSTESYTKVREQARIQFEGRQSGKPEFELLEREEGRGLAMLPAPSPGDFYFDIEGDPFALQGGLEYLLGWVSKGEAIESEYHHIWSLNREEELQGFETFVDAVLLRRKQFPDMHVYHFAPYEPSAIKRLMGRYGSREAEIDQLLRAGVFVDLHAATKQAVRASVERYSIKDLEQFYGFNRDENLREASVALRSVERCIELGHSVAVELRDTVEGYNKDDCVSTLKLQEWLESLRFGLEETGESLSRPEPKLREDLEVENTERTRIKRLLLTGLPSDAALRTKEEQATWLLGQMLDWHRQEEKAPWWEYFRLLSLSDEERLDERAALAGLEFAEEIGGTETSPIHRYRFVQQDSDVREDDALRGDGGQSVGTVAGINVQERTIDIKKRRAVASKHPSSVFAHRVIPAEEQANAILRMARWVAEHGIDSEGPFQACRDLLMRCGPRGVEANSLGSLLRREETRTSAACRLVAQLEGGILAIQGPPGTGKTYTAARMICELARDGKKVGITALSHKVIRNLLDQTVDAAEEKRFLIRCTQKVKGRAAKYDGDPIKEVTSNAAVRKQLESGEAQVAAGTPWLWAREDFAESIDVLFVDEAGQMSLPDVMAISHAARNVVLLGDPQQLEQPLLGSHPEGTEVSALQHVLGPDKTLPEDRGLFLEDTWRLSPAICELNSELFYEGRLKSRPELSRQQLTRNTDLSGLWYAPVSHDANSNASIEEADCVANLWRNMVAGTTSWRNKDDLVRPLLPRDVLIVAPYNAHVGLIADRLPHARVGTVDKFQGQEAVVAIYSMATSSPADAPRGMEFLYSLNRFNVATSRARGAVILVATEALFSPQCRSPRQIMLANSMCRYRELAKLLDPLLLENNHK